MNVPGSNRWMWWGTWTNSMSASKLSIDTIYFRQGRGGKAVWFFARHPHKMAKLRLR